MEELVIASNAFFFFFKLYLEHNEALSNNKRNKCFLPGVEGQNSKKAMEGRVESRTQWLPVRTLTLPQNVFWHVVMPTWEAQSC